MRRYILLLIAFLMAAAVLAQKNTLYMEAAGNGLFGSLNFERQLTNDADWLVRTGIGIYTENATYLCIPAGLDYLFKLKKPNFFLDAGMGITWAHARRTTHGDVKRTYNDNILHFIPSIGYRAHKERGLMWRVSVTPIINRYAFTPWAGFTVGKRF